MSKFNLSRINILTITVILLWITVLAWTFYEKTGTQKQDNVSVEVYDPYENYDRKIDHIVSILMKRSIEDLKTYPVPDHYRYVAKKIYGTTYWSDTVSAELLARVVRTESSTDSMAVSSIGAVGLGQIRPEIWKGEFPECGNDLFKVRDNLCYTVRVLEYYLEDHGDLESALLAYNGCKRHRPCNVYATRVMSD